ncbi:hypothetical protein FAI40_02565 [Acetobacteraceae bacterium]|nr:hypothetical protein FAI40_02565 [Acetobacteraceae bacterium]
MNKKCFFTLLVTGCMIFSHQVFAKAKMPSPTIQEALQPTALGGGMYLMKVGGLWGSVMHLPQPETPKLLPKKHEKISDKKAKSPLEKPDLCVASDQNQILLLRASDNGLEVRSIGKGWNLEKDALTSVKIGVGSAYKADLTMQALSDDQIGVPVNLEQMARLVEVLSDNDEAVLTYRLKEKSLEKGKKEKTDSQKTKEEIRKVSLKLAAPVFDNFRECVRFSGFLHAKDAKSVEAKKA